MRDGQHGAGIAVQELLQPQHALGVQVIGGLVQKQQVGCLKQQPAQGHAPAFTARQDAHRRIGIGALQRVHGLAQLTLEVPTVRGVNLVLQAAHLVHEGIEVGIGVSHLLADGVEAIHLGDDVGKGQLDVLDHGLVLVKRGLLQQDAHRVTGSEARLARRHLLEASHHLEQRRLPHAIGAHHADLGPRKEAHRHVVQDHLVAMRSARAIHLVYELGHVRLLLGRAPCRRGKLALTPILYGMCRTSIVLPAATRPCTA